MFTMALMSPVSTSMTMATPVSPFMSFSSFTTAASAMSCILMLMVVTMSSPLTGFSSTTLRLVRLTLLMCLRPGVPLSTLSNDISSPKRGESISPCRSPMTRLASDPKGLSLELRNDSLWNPPL